MRRKRQKTITCPGCGEVVTVMSSESPGRAASWIHYAPAARLPKSQREIEANTIPFRHGINTGGPLWFGSATALALCGVNPQQALGWGLVAGVAVFLPVYIFSARGDWKQFVLQVKALLVGPPPLGGEPARQPEPPQSDVWVPYKEPGHKSPHWKRHSIPWANRREARMVARAVLGWGKPFSRRALVAMNVLPDDPEHYKAIYQAMIKDKLLVKGSTTPTEKGELYLRGCLDDPPTPGAK